MEVGLSSLAGHSCFVLRRNVDLRRKEVALETRNFTRDRLRLPALRTSSCSFPPAHRLSTPFEQLATFSTCSSPLSLYSAAPSRSSSLPNSGCFGPFSDFVGYLSTSTAFALCAYWPVRSSKRSTRYAVAEGPHPIALGTSSWELLRCQPQEPAERNGCRGSSHLGADHERLSIFSRSRCRMLYLSRAITVIDGSRYASDALRHDICTSGHHNCTHSSM